jgi:hypothetical protein
LATAFAPQNIYNRCNTSVFTRNTGGRMQLPTPHWKQQKRRILCAILLFFALWTHVALASAPQGTDQHLAQQLAGHRGKPGALRAINLFQQHTRPINQQIEASKALRQGTILTLDAAAMRRIQAHAPKSFTLRLPDNGHEVIELELFRQDIFAQGFRIEASGGEDVRHIRPGLHYRGIIKNHARSFAAISVFEQQVSGSFASQAHGSWTLGRLNGTAANGQHVLFANSQLRDISRAPRCMTPAQAADIHSTGAAPAASNQAPCATEWLEAEYDIYQNKGSLQAVSDFLTGVFNNSSALYANDGITLQLSYLYIWTSEDPYNGSDTSSNLASFQQQRAASFSGTIAQLVTFRPLGGGVAAGFSGVCNADRRASMSTSSLYDSFSSVPAFSWSVDVLTHEAGHLLGSRHTHACVWNGNNTAIDGCAGYVEGGCALPGQPSAGGTVMSYCHLTAVGTNFNLGFGAQPAQAIRNQVATGACASGCASGPTAQPLRNHTPTAKLSAEANADLLYKIEVPAGSQQLEFNLWDGSGDVDLYVQPGTPPSLSSALCQSTSPTTRETCRVANPVAGTWYVLLHPYSAASNFTLNASHAGGCSGNLVLGLLANPGDTAIQPLSGGYLSSRAGLHQGISSSADNAEFNLELHAWNGSAWLRVAQQQARQALAFNGAAGWYRWQQRAVKGNGGYSLCQLSPG